MKTILSDFYDHIEKYKTLDKDATINSFMVKFDLNDDAKRKLVFNLIAEKFNLNAELIPSKTRKREYVDIRFMIMASLYIDKGFNIRKSGRFVNRNHTTANWAIKEVYKFIHIYNDYLDKYMAVREIIITTI